MDVDEVFRQVDRLNELGLIDEAEELLWQQITCAERRCQNLRDQMQCKETDN